MIGMSLCFALARLTLQDPTSTSVTVVDRPPVEGVDANYPGHRAPLAPDRAEVKEGRGNDGAQRVFAFAKNRGASRL